MAKSKAEIEKEIIRFLDENSTHKGDGTLPGCGLRHGIACALGTSKNNIPRVTPIDFFNDGLTLWIMGNAGEKLANIRSNPNVSVGIYTRMDHAKENRSIQLWGKASLITYRKQKELYMEIITKFPILDAIRQSVLARRDGTYHMPRIIDSARDEDFETELEKGFNNVTMIKVEPERIALLIIPPSPGTMEKLIWKKTTF